MIAHDMLPVKQMPNTHTDAEKVPAQEESTVGAPAEKAPAKIDPTHSTPAQNGSVNSTSNSNQAADRHVDTFAETEPACGPHEMIRADRAHPEQHPEDIMDDDAVVHALQCSEPDDELDEMIRAKIEYLQQHPEEIMDADAVVDVLRREDIWTANEVWQRLPKVPRQKYRMMLLQKLDPYRVRLLDSATNEGIARAAQRRARGGNVDMMDGQMESSEGGSESEEYDKSSGGGADSEADSDV